MLGENEDSVILPTNVFATTFRIPADEIPRRKVYGASSFVNTNKITCGETLVLTTNSRLSD